MNWFTKFLGIDDLRAQIAKASEEAKRQTEQHAQQYADSLAALTTLSKRVDDLSAQHAGLHTRFLALKKTVGELDANALKKDIDGLRADLLNQTIIAGRQSALINTLSARVSKLGEAVDGFVEWQSHPAFVELQRDVMKHRQELAQIKSAGDFQKLVLVEAFERVGHKYESSEQRVAMRKAAGLIR